MEVCTMNITDIPGRMKEIMEIRGMDATDFIRQENDDSPDNMKKITKSRFYDVLNGVNTNPKVDILQSFCDIAHWPLEDFFVWKEDSVAFVIVEKQLVRDQQSLSKRDLEIIKNLVDCMKKCSEE